MTHPEDDLDARLVELVTRTIHERIEHMDFPDIMCDMLLSSGPMLAFSEDNEDPALFAVIIAETSRFNNAIDVTIAARGKEHTFKIIVIETTTRQE